MASAALSALIEYSIIKEKSNLLCSFISLIKLHFKHISILHFAYCELSAMLESRKKDGVYDCPAIADSQPCMFFLFLVTFYHAHDIS